MFLSSCLHDIRISFEHVINVLFDLDIADLELQPIFRELNVSRLDFALGIHTGLLIYGIVIFVAFDSHLLDFILHNMDKLFILPI